MRCPYSQEAAFAKYGALGQDGEHSVPATTLVCRREFDHALLDVEDGVGQLFW
jgi:hypothetical protein